MREIVLSSSFVQAVQKLDKEYNILNTVQALARAMDELPCELVEEMLYHMLSTYTLGGRQLDQDELYASLLELLRIREEKDDGFMMATERWNCLENSEEYQAMAQHFDSPIEMGLALHTMENYLKSDSDPDHIEETIARMQCLETDVKKTTERANGEDEEAVDERILALLTSELIDICKSFCYREDYLVSCAWGCEPESFVIDFARLFILMASHMKDEDNVQEPDDHPSKQVFWIAQG